MQEWFHLEFKTNDEWHKAKRAFNKAARKIIKDLFSNAQIQIVVTSRKKVLKASIDKKSDAKEMHLTEKVPPEWGWLDCQGLGGLEVVVQALGIGAIYEDIKYKSSKPK